MQWRLSRMRVSIVAEHKHRILKEIMREKEGKSGYYSKLAHFWISFLPLCQQTETIVDSLCQAMSVSKESNRKLPDTSNKIACCYKIEEKSKRGFVRRFASQSLKLITLIWIDEWSLSTDSIYIFIVKWSLYDFSPYCACSCIHWSQFALRESHFLSVGAWNRANITFPFGFIYSQFGPKWCISITVCFGWGTGWEPGSSPHYWADPCSRVIARVLCIDICIRFRQRINILSHTWFEA